MKGRDNMDYMVSTGKIIKEYLNARSISQKELSARLGVSNKHISNVLNGNSRLTEEMALKLELVMPDIPASYWLNLESKYRENLARIKEHSALEEQDLPSIAKRFKFKEVFVDLDLSLIEQAYEMLKLLKISNFNNFNSAYADLPVSFMEDGGDLESIAIWLNLCEELINIQNDDLTHIPFNLQKLKKQLPMFKDLAYNPKIEFAISSCRKLCNRLGIYFVVNEAITNSKVRGALTTYNEHPAIFISFRFKTHDHIWFAILHELGHLIMHYDSKVPILSYEDDAVTSDKREIEASKFASDFFINSSDYEAFVAANSFTNTSIDHFAVTQNVLPGIIIARLQRDGIIRYNELNYMKIYCGRSEE